MVTRSPDQLLREINALHRKMVAIRFAYGAFVVAVLACMGLAGMWLFVKTVKFAIYLDW